MLLIEILVCQLGTLIKAPLEGRFLLAKAYKNRKICHKLNLIHLLRKIAKILFLADYATSFSR